MRRILTSAAVFGALALSVSAADVKSVKTVYVMPMANGLDQYLAARLAAGSLMQVVTDPQKADAVITDHVGEAFEKSMDELYGAVPAAKDAGSAAFARVGGGVRSRGTYFLVSRATRDVVWSDEETPKGTSPKETRRIAGRIADHLVKAMAK
jgi:Ni,Fe-hydrogenase III small subunit